MKFVVYFFVLSILINYSCESNSKKVDVFDSISSESNCDTIPFNKDTILERFWKEEGQRTDSTPNLILKMAAMVEKNINDPVKLYPFSRVDSVVVFYPYFTNKKIELKRYKRLDNDNVLNLLHLLNNPLYYSWGECGTPVEEFRFIFYSKKNVVGSTIISCDGNFVECEPENILIKSGGLNERGRNVIRCITKTVANL